MTNDLLVLVPSRGRPANLMRLICHMEKTCRGDTHLLVGLDADDPELERYKELWQDEVVDSDFEHLKTVEALFRPNVEGVVAWINYLGYMTADTYRYIGTLGDDNIPQTEGWDLRICASLKAQQEHYGLGFCYGDDKYPLRARGTLCTHVFMTSNVITRLGYMGPPSLKHMFVDDCWMQWAKATSIAFLADVEMEHVHHSSGASEHDDTYRRSEAFMLRDKQAYEVYCADPRGLTADIDRLKEEMCISRS